MMARSTSLAGPWTRRQLLHVSPRVDKEPNQGGFVQVPDGSWWFLTHQGTGDWEGRAMCLLPVQWIDGWPVIGRPGADGIGTMEWRARKPIGGTQPRPPALSDRFDGPGLSPEWEWNHAPRDGMWSLAERPGHLRLHAFAPATGGGLPAAGNTISQRAWRTRRNRATAILDLSNMADGQSAGLAHMSTGHAAIGLEQDAGVRRLIFRDSQGRVLKGPALAGPTLWLRSEWDIDGVSHFSFSLDGHGFEPFGPAYRLTWGDYRGDRIALYSFNDRGPSGWVDVGGFDYRVADQSGRTDGF